MKLPILIEPCLAEEDVNESITDLLSIVDKNAAAGFGLKVDVLDTVKNGMTLQTFNSLVLKLNRLYENHIGESYSSHTIH